VIVSLKGRNIPRNSVGDPCFNIFENDVDGRLNDSELEKYYLKHGPSLLEVFTREEVIELVNRSLYQLEYQARAHEKRRREQASLEAPIKEVYKRLYPKTSYAKATDEQLQRCIQELKKTSPTT